MVENALTGADAQALRRQWFRYLDTVEPLQPALHAYCLRLARNLWDAEDLVQEALLRAFAMTARGDFHGEASPVRSAKAYLFRTATNLWLDHRRRRQLEVGAPDPAEPLASDPDPVATDAALSHAAELTSARELAALLLKDVYDFRLEEVADFIGTTPGTVKSLLHRARRRVRANSAEGAVGAAEPDRAAGNPRRRADDGTRALVRALVEAMNARDVERVLGLMAESLKVDVCNVGGGRGRDGIWTERSLSGWRFEYAEHDGEPVMLLFEVAGRELAGAVRLEADGGSITRLVDYHYAADTLRALAGALGLDCHERGYHQPAADLVGMVSTTGLPWRS
ncbi:MAG TPA: sigma-70 family RNA polymerase sigma factor [Pseudomonadales bacterium]